MTDNDSLTGRWDGIFNYPRALPPTPFTADIVDGPGGLTGETVEVGQVGRVVGKPLHALIQGRRTGSGVVFRKIYDDAHDRPILYEGQLSGDGHEITGRWSIPGAWSGTFIMIRSPGLRRMVEQREGVQA